MDFDIYGSLNEFLLHYENVQDDIDRCEIIRLFFTKHKQCGIISISDHYRNNPCVDFTEPFLYLHMSQDCPDGHDFVNRLNGAKFDNMLLSVNESKSIKNLFRTQYAHSFRISTRFGNIPKQITKLQMYFDRKSDIVNFVVRS